MNKITYVAVCLCTVLSQQLYAALITYPDKTTFLNAISTPTTTETFNSFTSDSDSFGNSSLTVGDMTFSAGYGWVGSTRNKIDAPPHIYVSLDVDGTTVLNCFVTQTTDMTITFAESINYFGANLANFSTVSTTSFSVDNSSNDSIVVPSYAAYIGISSDTSFNTITISADGNNGFGMDNIAYAIPEPASIGLIVLFSGGLWTVRRWFPV